MNHCLLEVRVKQAPTVRYTQDNKTPLAEMEVLFDGLRAEDQPGNIKVVGWGNLAQEIQKSVQQNQKLIIEGRLRMNTIPRKDGTKEKKAEFTLSRLHLIPEKGDLLNSNINSSEMSKSQKKPSTQREESSSQFSANSNQSQNDVSWDSSPLIPETDEIPF